MTLPGVPAAALSVPNQHRGGFSPATLILVVEVLGLAFIGLVSVASFSVMAQRRLRALGMLSAIGATERNLRLVMIVNGLAVGVAGALAGAVLGLAAWFAYAPTLQQATGHVVDPANLPWWAIAIGAVFAIVTSVLASRRPAKTMAAVPVVAALSGRPAPPKAVHRSALPGVIAFAVGLACLAFAGGLAGPPGGGGGPSALPLLVGLVGVIVGIVLLAPLAISVLTAGAGPRLPVAIRIALRDLVRYRARSGAALAAATFAVFLAMVICLVGSDQFDNPLSRSGPNLSSSQLVVYRGPQPGPRHDDAAHQRPGGQPEQAAGQPRRQPARAVRGATGIRGATLYQAGARTAAQQLHRLRVRGHPAAARHVRDQGQPDRSRHRRPHLAARAGRPAAHGDDLGNYGSSNGPGEPGAVRQRLPSCTPSNDCLASPAMQTVSSLPSGTSAPNTVITEYAVRKYHLQTQLSGWLIQAPAPLTATQIRPRGNSHSPTRRRSRSPPAGRTSARSPTAAPRSASSSRSACWPRPSA